MAFTCKPNVKELGVEAKYKLISCKSNIYSSSSYSVYEQHDAAVYLFDGKIDGNVMSWYYHDDYVEIEILEKCNIWVYTGTHNLTRNMYIEKKIDNDEFINISNEDNTSIVDEELKWSKVFHNIDKGTYRIKATGNIVNDEWYLEKIKDIKYLIKQGDIYYSIKSDYYCEKKFDNTLILADNIECRDKAIKTLKNLDLSKIHDNNYNIIKLP